MKFELETNNNISLTMSLKIVSVEPVKYDFSKFKEIEDKARKLLPEKTPEIIVLEIIANARIANAIRRTLLDEIKSKSLEPGRIETDDVYVLKDVLANNIKQIPIDQSIPIDAKFKLAVENNRTNLLPVKSKQIKSSINNPFNSRIELCALNPGKLVRIKDISVVEGRGKHDARFSLVSTIGYKMLDFMEVYYLNTKNKCESYILPTEQIASLAGMKPRSIIDKKVLIIPTKDQQTHMSNKLKERLRYYDVVIEPMAKSKSKMDLTKLHNYQSTEYHAKEFRLTIKTLGTIAPNKLLDLALSTILQELKYIFGMKEYAVELSQSDDVYHFQLKNSSHTLGEAINYTIYQSNPEIALVNLTKRDPISNSIVINIKHSSAEKLFKSAVGTLIKTFESMRANLNK